MGSSRRNFIKLGAFTAASATLACSGSAFAATSKTKWDEIVDVLVIGSGVAGISAAVSALDSKAKVLIAEKMAVLGGASAISNGTLAVLGSPQQKAKGIKDDLDVFVQDMLKEGNWYGQEHLMRNLASVSSDAYNYIVSKGALFEDYLIPFPGMSIPRILQPKVSCAEGILRPLQKYFLEKGGAIRTRCKVDEILFDEKGNITGVKVRENYRFDFSLVSDDVENKSGEVKYIKVKGGIICATGGYANDKIFMQQEFPQFTNVYTTQQPGATASGFRLLANAGARMLHTTFYRPAFPEANNMHLGMMVDAASGKRFTNETLGRVDQFNVAGRLMSSNGGRIPLSILDSESADLMGNKPHVKVNINAGYVTIHQTLDELVDYYSIPKAEFKASVTEYNAMIKSGKDTKFNRIIEKGKHLEIIKPPFYALQVRPDMNYNVGGALPTIKGEVIGLNTNAPISGLYVAGEASGGIYGTSRLLGCSIMDGICSGHVAGIEAAKKI